MDRRFNERGNARDRRVITKRLRRRKRKRLTLIALFIAAAAALAAIGGYFLFKSIQNKNFDVKHIMVVGNETINNKTVIDAARIPVDTCIFTLDMNQVYQNISERINCSYLMVSKKFPDTVVVNIQENPVLCAVVEGESVYYLSDRYEVVETGSYLGRTDIPLLTGLSGCSGAYIGQTVELKPSGKAEDIRTILLILSNSQYLQRLSEIAVESDGSLRIITKNNLVIHFKDLAQFKEKYDYIGSILEKNKSNQEVDLTLGEKIIVKKR